MAAPISERNAARSLAPSLTKRVLQQIHLWLGVGLSIPLITLGITGTILTFQHGFDDSGQDKTRLVQTVAAQPISRIIEAAQAEAPQGSAPAQYTAPTEPGAPAIVRLQTARGGNAAPGGRPNLGIQVTVDPATLNVSKPADPSSGFLRTLHILHGSLMIPGRDGREIVGWLGVVMLGMGISGVVLWWPRAGRWKAAFKVRKHATGAQFHRELHGAVGIWALVVFIVVSFSGVYLAFPETTGSAMSVVLPDAHLRPNAPPPPVSRPAEAQAIDIDRAVAIGQQALPAYFLRSAAFPARPDQPYRLVFAQPGAATRAPAATVFVDPYAAQVMEVRDPSAQPIGQRVAAWQRALHEGSGLGVVWQILVGLSGLLPALFAVTGISMWLMRRRAKARLRATRETTAIAAEAAE